MAPRTPIADAKPPLRAKAGVRAVALSLTLLISAPAHPQLAVPASVTTTTSLHAQSTQSALTRRWPPAINSRLSWLVLDLSSGQIISHQGPDPDLPIPVGSLTKPFLALAYILACLTRVQELSLTLGGSVRHAVVDYRGVRCRHLPSFYKAH